MAAQISLVCSWPANPVAEQISSYNIFLDDTKVESPTTPSYVIPNVTPGSHTVAVSAVNSLTEGPKSDAAIVNVPALPTKVGNVQVQISFTVS